MTIVKVGPPHVRVYMDFFDIGIDDIWWDEATGTQHKFRDMTIHHIHGRGKDKDIIENLMCLQLKTHQRAHGTKDYVTPDEFTYIHNCFLNGQRKTFLK